MTFKPHKLVLFKKEGCEPCQKAQEALDNVLSYCPQYEEHVAVMQKENHSALVAAYKLETYPTVLVLDRHCDEIKRGVGYKNLTIDFWHKALSKIHQLEKECD